MKKIIAMQDLDCANCAAKMERSIRQIDGVHSCSINFILQRMTLDIEDERAEEILQQIRLAVRKTEPDCKLRI